MMCPRLHAPIVLAHGLFGFDQIALGRLTLATYFRGIPETWWHDPNKAGKVQRQG